MACLRSALKVRMVVVDRFDIEQVKGYTIMPNYHQRDRTLSIKAKGILSQMFSLPEGWDYTLRGLAYLNTDGIDSMRSGIVKPTGPIVPVGLVFYFALFLK